MAIAHVGDSTYARSALTGTSLTNTYTTTAGNTLVVYITGYISGNTAISVTSVTDSTGGTNTWTVVPGTSGYYSASNYSGCTAIAFCVGAAAVTSVTAHFSAVPGVNAYVQVSQFSGVPSGAGIDGSASASFAGISVSSQATPGVIPVSSTDLVISIAATNTAFTSASPGTMLLDGQADWNIVTAPLVSQSVTFTGTNNIMATQTLAIGLKSINKLSSTPAAVDLTGSTSATVSTASFSPPAGSMVVVAVNIGIDVYGAMPAFTVEDSGGTSYVAGPTTIDIGYTRVSLFSNYYAVAPGSITVTATRTLNTAAALFELVSYVLADVSASQVGAGSGTANLTSNTETNTVEMTVSTTVTGSWLIVTCGMDADVTGFVAVNITTDHTESSSPDNEALVTGHSVTATPGSTTLGWTFPVNGGVSYAMAALEILPAGAPTSVSSSDTGTGSDADTYFLPQPQADTGTGSDTGSGSMPVSGTDVLTGTDTVASVSAAVADNSEAGSGLDTAGITAVLPGGLSADAGTGADGAVSVSAAVYGTDLGSGSGTYIYVLPLSLPDTGSGSDTVTSLTARLLSPDTGTWLDAGVIQVSASPTGADSGIGTDTGLLATEVNYLADLSAGTEGPARIGVSDVPHWAG